VEEINNGSGPQQQQQPLLPGVTLGYRLYDVCSLPAGILATVNVLRDQEQREQQAAQPGSAPGPTASPVAVIGPDSSTRTMPPAVLLGAYLVPQVTSWC